MRRRGAARLQQGPHVWQPYLSSSDASTQVVREASDRVLGLRPFDVQLIGGVILHEGQIAEMRTGEGKTLVAVLPAYLNALPARGGYKTELFGYDNTRPRYSTFVNYLRTLRDMDVSHSTFAAF